MNSVDHIFKYRLIENYLTKFTKSDIPDFEAKWKKIKLWRKSCIEGNLNQTKETSIQGAFMVQVFEYILGYLTQTGTEDDIYNQTQEYKSALDSSEADGALGFFSKSTKSKDVRVVIELKDATKDLDKKQNRSNHLTPVEQAFQYANKNGARCGWVIVSNFIETRLYKSNSSLEYETFDIRKMDDEKEFVRFYFFLCKDHMLNSRKSFLDNLYQENEEIGIAISNDFYKTYKKIRNNLYEDLKSLNPNKDDLFLFTKTQKIMDRFTFICFCEDCGLLPQHVIKQLIDTAKNSFSSAKNKLWNETKGLFLSIDRGNPQKQVNRYNGGLFREDNELDNLSVSDNILESFLELATYDFNSDLNVNILGQIFEQSITDVEQIKNEINSIATDTRGKQKDDGIFYTPYYVTRYIVEQTVGRYLEEKKDELKKTIFVHGAFEAAVKKRSTKRINKMTISSWVEIPDYKDNMSEEEEMYRKAVIQLHQVYWDLYEEVLKNIKICDPACGSGAFINQCFDYLHEEMNFLLDMKYNFNGQEAFCDIDKEILQNNLYGVDINPESVEITKLSLWLKTAKKNQALSTLDGNIKCGNSIVADKNIAEDAFNWQKEFPEVFDHGGFDIIVGNPPYGAKLNQLQKDYLAQTYITTEYNYDTYKTFFELGFSLLKKGGYLGYITPNTFFALESGANKLRKFLFDNHTMCRIVEVYNVFPSAIVEPAITVFQNKPPANEIFTSICIPRNIKLTSTFLNEGVVTEYSQSDLKKDSQYIFNYRSTKNDQAICEDMKKHSRLDTLFHVMTGAKPYQVGKGNPPQTKEMIKEKPYTGYEKIDDSWVPYMRGRSVERYVCKWKSDRGFIKYGEWLAEPRNPEVFAGEKIFIRQTGDSIIANIDCGNVSNNTLHSIYPKETNNSIGLYYLLGLLNSKLLNWYYQRVNYLEFGKVMAEVKGIYIKKLPVAVGTEKQVISVETYVRHLLDLCQQKYDIKYAFTYFLKNTYGLKKVTERIEHFDMLTFKTFIEELKKQKIKLAIREEVDLLNEYDRINDKLADINKNIELIQDKLDELVIKIYNIPNNAHIDFNITL